MSDLVEDAKIGGRAKDLLRALSDFADVVAVDAPTPVLARQLDEMETIFRDLDSLAGTGLCDNDVWSVLSDPMKLMRLYEVLQHRQAQKTPTE